MKTIILSLALFVGMAFAGAAQDRTSETLNELNVIPAQFMGFHYSNDADLSTDAFKQFITNNIKYPEDALKWSRQGTEIVQFTVSENGDVKDINIVNSICPSIDIEFVRVLESTNGMWRPALKDGYNYDCFKEVSLTFSLNDNKEEIADEFLKLATKNYLRGSELLLVHQNFKKAERLMSNALKYMPHDSNLLYMRGICRYQNGDKEGALEDWNRYTDISGYEAPETIYAEELKDFEAYAAFLSLKEKK